MNKLFPLLITIFVGSHVFAATGFFGNSFIIADGSTFYELTNNTVNPKLSDGFGTLDTALVTNFDIQGFEINTFEDNGSEITHMNLFWTVDDFANTHQIQITPAPAKTGNDRFWQITSGTQNILTNNGIGALANGDYTFKAYLEGYTNGTNTDGNIFYNNGGANYTGDFTVIPEPSSMIMLGLSGLAASMISLAKRRKRA